MTSSAGPPESPVSPLAPGVSTCEISIASIGFRAYLTTVFLSWPGAFQSIDSSVTCTSAIFFPAQPRPQISATKHHIFTPSLLYAPRPDTLLPTNHNASSTILRPRPFTPNRPLARARCADFPAADPARDFIRRARHPDPPPACPRRPGTCLPGPRPVRPDGFHSCVRLTSDRP